MRSVILSRYIISTAHPTEVIVNITTTGRENVLLQSFRSLSRIRIETSIVICIRHANVQETYIGKIILT